MLGGKARVVKLIQTTMNRITTIQNRIRATQKARKPLAVQARTPIHRTHLKTITTTQNDGQYLTGGKSADSALKYASAAHSSS